MKTRTGLLLIILLHVFYLAFVKLFIYPEILTYPYLFENGAFPYIKLLDQHVPSFLMSPLNFRTLGIVDPFSGRVFAIVLIICTHIGIFLNSKYLNYKKETVIPNSIYLFIQPLFEGHVLWIDNIVGVLLVFAFYFLVRLINTKLYSDALYVGSLLGFALWIKQTLVILILICLLFLIIRTKSYRIVFFVAVFASMPMTATIIWLIFNNAFFDFYYWAGTFNIEIYAPMAKKAIDMRTWLKIFAFVGIPFFLLLGSLLKSMSMKLISPRTILQEIATTDRNSYSFLLLSFIVSVGIIATTRFELSHLQPIIPFLALAAFYIWNNKAWGKIFLCIPIILGLVWWRHILKQDFRGEYYFFDDTFYKTSESIKSYSKKDNTLFILGAQPLYYPFTNTRPPANTFTVSVPWNYVASQEKIYQSLVENPPAIVLRDPSATIDGKSVTEFAGKINTFINEHYTLQESIGDNQLLIPKDK